MRTMQTMNTKEQVLCLLERNRDRHVSGERLAEAIGVSRNAVWKAVRALRAEGYAILDVDSVIAAQAPKLSPHRDAMRANLAAAMGIPVENVGVKATTTEHLGFEGREEGISATAACLLCRCS